MNVPVPYEALLEKCKEKLGDAMLGIAAHEVASEQKDRRIAELEQENQDLKQQLGAMAERLENDG